MRVCRKLSGGNKTGLSIFNEISAAVFSKYQLQNLQPCHSHSISLCTITWLTENEHKCQMKLTGSHNYDKTSLSMSWGSCCCCFYFTQAVNRSSLTYSPIFRELVDTHVGMKSYVIHQKPQMLARTTR